MLAHQLQCPRHPGLQRVVGGFETEHEKGVAAVADAGEHGFQRVQQAAVGRVQARLRERPHAGHALGVVVETNRSRGAKARRILQPHPGLGDHAQRALRAQHHPVGCRASPGAGQAARLHHAGGGDQAGVFDEVVDVGVLHRVVATGARGDPAAERGELEALRKVPQRQAVRLELGFEFGPQRAGLDARSAAGAVDLQHAVQPFEVHRHRARVAGAHRGLDAAAHAAAAAIGHHRDIAAGRPVQQVDDGLLVVRVGHPVRRLGHVAQPHAREVGVALAVAVVEPVQRLAGENRGQRGRRADPGGSQREVFNPRRRPFALHRAELVEHEAQIGLFTRVERGVGLAPAPETAWGAAGEGLGCHGGSPGRH